MKKYYILLVALILASFILAQCAPSAPSSSSGNPAPAAGSGQSLEGQKLAEERCSTCHGFERVKQLKKSPEEWTAIVNRMVGHGAQLSDSEKQAVINYLSTLNQ